MFNRNLKTMQTMEIQDEHCYNGFNKNGPPGFTGRVKGKNEEPSS